MDFSPISSSLRVPTPFFSDMNEYYADLMNNGLGPAIIESFIVKIDDEEVPGKRSDVFEKALEILFPDINYSSHHAFLAKDYSMASKEKRTLIAIKFANKEVISPEEVDDRFNRLDLIIKYKSFYGEEFEFSSVKNKSNK